jgi:hypothetical protein
MAGDVQSPSPLTRDRLFAAPEPCHQTNIVRGAILLPGPVMFLNGLPGLRPSTNMDHVRMLLDKAAKANSHESLHLTLEALVRAGVQSGGTAVRLLRRHLPGPLRPNAVGCDKRNTLPCFPLRPLYEVNLSTWRAEAVGVDDAHCFLTASIRVWPSQLDDNPPKAAPPTLCH